MSGQALDWARSVRLGPGRTLGVVRRCVLVVIADLYRDKFGFAWPSIAALADACDAAEASVSRAVAELEMAGLLTVERHPRRPSRYRPTWATPFGIRSRTEEAPQDEAPHAEGPQGVNPGPAGSQPRARRESTQGPQAEGLIQQEIQQEIQGSHAGARDLPPEQWGKGWGEPAGEEEQEPDNLVPQEPIGPSQHAFYSSGQPSAETRPSSSASATRESASPVVSDVERAVAYYAEVAPLALRKTLRGPSRARGDVEAAVVRYGVDAVCAAVDDARRARADGCPPWQWIADRLEGRTTKVNGTARPRVSGDPRKSEGWSWKP